MYLLCTDLHLDDKPANEYRWHVFDELERAILRYPVTEVHCLGDMTDRKVISASAPVFSARMVDRVRSSWKRLGRRVFILRGNHDATVTGPPDFWEFLSEIDDVEYVARPTLLDDLLLLPFSPNPRTEWSDLPFRDCCAIFTHATRSGAIAENGYALVSQDLPTIPRSVKVYSGDVHTQQVVDNWTYVGASHPVKFGDGYQCRFLLLDDDYEVVEEIPVNTIGRRVISVSSLDDLLVGGPAGAEVAAGDQVKIRVSCPPGSTDWAALEAAIGQWAREHEVEVSSVEAGYEISTQSAQASAELPPEDLLRAFAAEEGVADSLVDVGLELLREVR